jgi:hypothetical protein
MDILKDIIELLIGLIALATAIVVMRTQIIKYKCQQNKSITPDTMPNPSTQISTSSQRSSLWSRMGLLERIFAIFSLVVFPFFILVLLWVVFLAPPHQATLRDVAFVGLLVAMILITSRPPHDT